MGATGDPLKPDDARRLIKAILEKGEVILSRHAEVEMANDNLLLVDCTNVLRCGVVDPPDLEKGTWRYRVATQRIRVVVAFRSDTKLVIVTAWREKQ